MRRTVCSFYESVPGSTVENFKETDAEVTFTVSAPEDVQFTLELEPESEYEVLIDGESAGKMNTKFERKAQCKCRTFSRSECSDQSSKVLIC